MKFFSDIRLLLLGLWLGAAVFFIAVAQTAFAVLPQREMAGAVVGRTLSILNFGGMAIGVVLLLTSFLTTQTAVNRFLLWVERSLLLVVAAACGVGQFVIGWMLASVRTQLGRPIDEVAADDPLRLQFNSLHEWSVWVLFGAMIAALLAFFIIANRRNASAKKTDPTAPYDFSKEFKI